MKMTNKAVLAMAIAASLGTITSTQAAIILGNPILAGSTGANTPLIVAEELSLQTTDAFVNDDNSTNTSANRLVINVPTIPGYETNANNKLFVKLALLDGATFAGAAVLKCVASALPITIVTATDTEAAVLDAINTPLRSALTTADTAANAAVNGAANGVFSAVDAANDTAASPAIATSALKDALDLAMTGTNAAPDLGTAANEATINGFKTNVDNYKAAIDAIADKAAALNVATANTVTNANLTLIAAAQSAINALIVPTAKAVLVITNAQVTTGLTAIQTAVDAAIGSTVGVNLPDFTSLLGLAAFVDELAANQTTLVPALSTTSILADIDAAKAAFGTLPITVPTTADLAALKLKTVALKNAITAVGDRANALNATATTLSPTQLGYISAAQGLVDTADTAVDTAILSAAALAAAELEAVAATSVASTFTTELTQNGKKDDTQATFSIAAGKTLDAVKPCILTVKGVAADGLTAYYNINSQTNQRMSALVEYVDGLTDISTSYISEFITFAPAIGVSASLKKVGGVEADAVIDVKEAGQKFMQKTTLGQDQLNAFVGSITFNTLYDTAPLDDATKKPVFPTSVKAVPAKNIVSLTDLVATANITISSPSLTGVKSVHLHGNADQCQATPLVSSTPNGDTSVTFSNVTLTNLEEGINVCIEVDGVTAIPEGQFTVSITGVSKDSSNVVFGVEANLYDLGKNGVTHEVLNIPGSTSADQAYIRMYNVSSFPGKILGTMYDQSGNLIGTAGTEVVSLNPREVKVINAAGLEAIFGTWNQRARLILDADVDNLRVQALIRSGNVLENMSGRAAD